MSKIKLQIDNFLNFIKGYFKHTFLGYIIALFLYVVILIISCYIFFSILIIEKLYTGNLHFDYIFIYILLTIFELVIMWVLYILFSKVIKKYSFELLSYIIIYIILAYIFYKLAIIFTDTYSYKDTLMVYIVGLITLPPYISIVVWLYCYIYLLYKSKKIDKEYCIKYQFTHTFSIILFPTLCIII